MLGLVLNGNERQFEDLVPGSPLPELVQRLGFRLDRVAVEHNGEIVPRSKWAEAALQNGDRLEIVHFVGGGIG